MRSVVNRNVVMRRIGLTALQRKDVAELLALVRIADEVVSSWNVMAHGDAREGKLRRNWRMEWVASTLHTTSQHGVSSITTADAHTSAASSRLNWRPPADLNGLVRFAERRNLFCVRVSSHFKRSVHTAEHILRCAVRNSITELLQRPNNQVAVSTVTLHAAWAQRQWQVCWRVGLNEWNQERQCMSVCLS